MSIININSNTFNNIDLEPESKPMKTGKVKSWLGEYHWVSLRSTGSMETNIHKLALAWCNETYGKGGRRWYENQKKFFFKDEKDMTMFVLRWCDA